MVLLDVIQHPVVCEVLGTLSTGERFPHNGGADIILDLHLDNGDPISVLAENLLLCNRLQEVCAGPFNHRNTISRQDDVLVLLYPERLTVVLP